MWNDFRRQAKNIKFWLVLLTDILLLSAAHVVSYIARFDGRLTPDIWQAIRLVLPWLLAGKMFVFMGFGLYRGMWRYTGVVDFLNILKASVVVTLATICAIVYLNRFEGFSRSVFLLDGVFTFLFISGHRIAIRLFYQRFQAGRAGLHESSQARNGKRLLIMGAGDAAEKVTREIMDNLALPYRIVGFLDDAPLKVGKHIHGFPVLAFTFQLPEVLSKMRVDEILIAMPSATRDQMGRIVDLCRDSGVPYKTVPGLGEIINDKVSIRAIRDVSYKDLLGRPAVRLEQEKIGEILRGKTVLVSGAGGSIGSELCRQILKFQPRLLVLWDASEENLYQLEMEVLHEHGFASYVAILGRVQDQEVLDSVFTHYRPQIVFHAAAYKHVPMVEKNPWEGIYNNVFATRRLIRTSAEQEVERFILVSSDKAVRPTNVMGATKRMTERIMQAYCESGVRGQEPGVRSQRRTRFMAVRFGNVLGSSGSVIPLFKRQIELGGPVTVTHPEITRYFMSIEEASQLILQAASMGKGGEIFILEMGTPVRIAQMARDLIRLCGKEPDTEIEIKYTGLRPGEKLYEELITEGEGIVPTGHEKIMVLRGDGCSLMELEGPLARLKEYAQQHDAAGIKRVLQEVVAEYTPKEIEAVLPPLGSDSVAPATRAKIIPLQ
ncbi:MAG: nucleoside-diphosphate sugar epimerase/dehydratase [Thermodesulfobacteriota bacterium]